MNKIIFIIIFLLLNYLLYSKSNYEDFDHMLNSNLVGSVEFINTEELEILLKTENNIYILDIRSLAEYEISRIKGARFIDYKAFKLSDVKDIRKFDNIVLYCSVGYRSERVGEILLEEGYTNVYNLYGGIFKWVNEERIVVDSFGQTDKIHGHSKNWARWITSGHIVY